MKKLVSILLALMLVMSLAPSFAEGSDEYPEVIEGIDFGGATLYINPYWTPPGRVENPTDDQQAQYDFQDWIMKTYNVKIVEEQLGNWGDPQVEEIQNFMSKGDASELRIFIMPPGFVGSPMANGWFADWANNDLINLSDEKWNAGDVEFMTKGTKTLGVALGNPEPRQCVYFNKTVLEKAGIDWNTIYDMQKDGTWNWENFEKLVAQVHKDADSDGVPDVYGLTGNFTDFLMASVFNNGGSFFDFDENGKLVVTAGSDNVIEAETWATEIWNNYARAEDGAAGDAWNYFIDVFKSGNCGFCIHQTYGGYNEGDTDLSGMQDPWGCVAIPKGPKGDDYYYLISDNIVVVPSIYDDQTTKNIEYIYSQYAGPIPGVDDSDAWIGSKYEICSDTRAVDETYAMLRESKHGKANKSSYLGTDNLVLGSDTYGNYLWGMRWSTPAALFEGIKPAWEGLCAVFNGDMTEEEFNKQMEEKKAADEAKAAEEAAAAAEAPAEEPKAE